MHTDLAAVDKGERTTREPVPGTSSPTTGAAMPSEGDVAKAAGRIQSSAPRASLEAQLDALPAHVRLAMVTVAASASSADEALAPVISLLVDGPEDKRAAIVEAFRTNFLLRSQWERTYQILRAEAGRK